MAATPRNTPSQPAPDDDLTCVVIALDAFDHHARFDAEHARPYPLAPVDGQLLTHGKGRRAPKVLYVFAVCRRRGRRSI